MNDLQRFNSTDDKTPIEVLLEVDGDGKVSARKLYEFLEMLPRNFNQWCTNNILNNEFAEENVDYCHSLFQKSTPTGGKYNGKEYLLSVEFAKKLCMITKTQRGEEARDYFIIVERALKEVVQTLPQLSQSELILRIAQTNVELEKRINTLEDNQQQIEKKFNTAIEVFSAPGSDWTTDMNNKINQMISDYKQSPSGFRAILYRELESAASISFPLRLAALDKRMKKQGATYKERIAVTKLDVISRDKKLRPIFEGIVRKHQAAFSSLF